MKKENVELHPKLLEFLTRVAVDIIEDTVEDDPEKVTTILKTNDFLYSLKTELLNSKLRDIVGEDIMNEILEEIKNNI